MEMQKDDDKGRRKKMMRKERKCKKMMDKWRWETMMGGVKKMKMKVQKNDDWNKWKRKKVIRDEGR